MYDVNDILTQLQNGQDPEALAKAFTDSLNQAMVLQKKAATAQAQHDDLAAIITTLIDYINKYYPEAELELSDEEMNTMISEIDEMIPTLLNLINSVKTLPNLPFMPKVKASEAKPKTSATVTVKKSGSEPVTFKGTSFEDAMNQFFKQNGLK